MGMGAAGSVRISNVPHLQLFMSKTTSAIFGSLRVIFGNYSLIIYDSLHCKFPKKGAILNILN